MTCLTQPGKRQIKPARPGVLAQVAAAFAEHQVSIQQVRQDTAQAPASAADGEAGEAGAELVIVTHAAPDAALSATVDALAGLDIVLGVTSVMRVEGD